MKNLYLFLIVLFFLVTSENVFAEDVGSISGRIFYRGELFQSIPEDENSAALFNVGWNIGRKKLVPKLAGTKIQLIDTSIDMNSLSQNEITDWYRNGITPMNRKIFLAVTDDRGKFYIDNIPEGDYYFVTITPYRIVQTSTVHERIAFEHFIRDWEDFEIFVVGMGSNTYDIDKIKVLPKQNILNRGYYMG